MAARPLRVLIVMLAVAIVAVAALALWRVSAAFQREPLPVLGTVPEFTLVDQHGAQWTKDDLAGHPWVADFVFTRCPAICPRMSEMMRQVDSSLGATSNARLVSISVDPLHDRPSVLAQYAERHQASPRWHFLTVPEGGDPQAIYSLARAGMKLAVEPSPPAELANELILHSNRFVLVDDQSQIRGYYDPFDPNELERLIQDLGDLGG